MTVPVNIIETKTNEIDEATNGLQFSTNSFITIVLFCVIVVVSPIISSHSSAVNFAAFFCTHIHNYEFSKQNYHYIFG